MVRSLAVALGVKQIALWVLISRTMAYELLANLPDRNFKSRSDIYADCLPHNGRLSVVDANKGWCAGLDHHLDINLGAPTRVYAIAVGARNDPYDYQNVKTYKIAQSNGVSFEYWSRKKEDTGGTILQGFDYSKPIKHLLGPKKFRAKKVRFTVKAYKWVIGGRFGAYGCYQGSLEPCDTELIGSLHDDCLRASGTDTSKCHLSWGKLNTAGSGYIWCSASANPWWEANFGQTVTITAVASQVRFSDPGLPWGAVTYEVSYSADGTNWVQLPETFHGNTLATPMEYFGDRPLSATEVRFEALEFNRYRSARLGLYGCRIQDGTEGSAAGIAKGKDKFSEKFDLSHESRAASFGIKGCGGGVVHIRTCSKVELFIYLGVDSNTKSYILKQANEPYHRAHLTAGVLGCAEMKKFWVQWEENVVRVGAGSHLGIGEFMARSLGEKNYFTDISFSSYNDVDAVDWFVDKDMMKMQAVQLKSGNGAYLKVASVQPTSAKRLVVQLKPSNSKEVQIVELRDRKTAETQLTFETDAEGSTCRFIKKSDVVSPKIPCKLELRDGLLGFWMTWADGVAAFGAGERVGDSQLVARNLDSQELAQSLTVWIKGSGLWAIRDPLPISSNMKELGSEDLNMARDGDSATCTKIIMEDHLLRYISIGVHEFGYKSVLLEVSGKGFGCSSGTGRSHYVDAHWLRRGSEYGKERAYRRCQADRALAQQVEQDEKTSVIKCGYACNCEGKVACDFVALVFRASSNGTVSESYETETLSVCEIQYGTFG